MYWLLHQIAKHLPPHGWSPVGRQLWIRFDGSGDSDLIGVARGGLVRAFDVADDGSVSRLLIELPVPLDYRGHYRDAEITWLTVESCLAWRTLALLPFTWSAVRLVDAPSFADSTYDRTIGTGRVALEERRLAKGVAEQQHATVPPTLSGGALDEALAVHLRQISAAARKMSALLERGGGADQLADIAMVVSRIVALANAIAPRLPAPRAVLSRDRELVAVMSHIKASLQALEGFGGLERDRRLAVLESFTRPHALALFHEICRLDEVLLT